MEENYSKILKRTKKTIRQVLNNTMWWSYVQDEVKEKIEEIINHIDKLGVPFRDTYISMFKYTHIYRMIKGQSKFGEPGVFAKLSEEAYQSAINPTKYVLQLNDWVHPSDADVQACMQLCHHIEIFASLGIINDKKDWSTISSIVSNKSKSNKDIPPFST